MYKEYVHMSLPHNHLLYYTDGRAIALLIERCLPTGYSLILIDL
jgi:hypothetical protein